MKNTLLFCAFCMSIALAGAEPVAASSILIDFESTGLSEGQSLATEIPGMIFTNAIISEEGSPMTAFQGHNGIGLNDRTRGRQGVKSTFDPWGFPLRIKRGSQVGWVEERNPTSTIARNCKMIERTKQLSRKCKLPMCK